MMTNRPLKKGKIVISACLAGVNCKYDGGNNFDPKVKGLVDEGRAILVCPEELGGLSTPRSPAEIVGDKVLRKNGEDVTANFKEGANKALEIAKKAGCKKAILKARSPSCGAGQVYDGTFSHTLVAGDGFFARLLEKEGFEILTEDDL